MVIQNNINESSDPEKAEEARVSGENNWTNLLESIYCNQNKLLERMTHVEEELQSIRKEWNEKNKPPPTDKEILDGTALNSNAEKQEEFNPAKCFVLTHVFDVVSEMEDNVEKLSEIEEHFGCSWSILIEKSDDYLDPYLCCEKSLDNDDWSIDTEFIIKLGPTERKCNYVFGNMDEKDRFESYGTVEFMKWNEMMTDFAVDDTIKVEIHVQIKKTIGVYKENLRSFDESMEEFSDGILIVNKVKFYVLKLYLAAHSSYFKALFLGRFQESSKSEIQLTGIDADDFQNYLEVLYGDPAIDETTVEGILLVADMYDTGIVIAKCEDFLLEKSEKSLKKRLQMAMRYRLDKLKEKCMSEIKTVDDIRAVIAGNISDLDPLITAELFEKSLSLH